MRHPKLSEASLSCVPFGSILSWDTELSECNKPRFTRIGSINLQCKWFQFSSVQSLSCVRLFATTWIAASQATLSITNSWSSLRLMCIELMMPSNHLILCRPLLLLPQIPPSIRVFSNESTLRMRWPKYWSFSLSISLSNEHPGLISFRMDWLDLPAVQGTLKSLGDALEKSWRSWLDPCVGTKSPHALGQLNPGTATESPCRN